MGLFKRKRPCLTCLTATLNERIMPVDRHVVYEDPLEEFLMQGNTGSISGGGTMHSRNGEIEFCDIDIDIYGKATGTVKKAIIGKLEELGAPKGSKLAVQDGRVPIPFGRTEGLAIYLDGVNLDDRIYEECDVNNVVDGIKRLIGDDSDIVRHWIGDTETALYFYSDSFEEMKAKISGFVSEYPLCRNSRIVRIA